MFPADTIVAIATAPGLGAVAMVRLSGSAAFRIARVLAPGFDPAQPRVTRLLSIQGADSSPIDQALVTAFPGPGSYTGEDVVEFATHGGVLVPAQVVAAAIQAGARQALPGEFTRRAVIEGKLDLLQAEAVGDLIAATAPAQARQALQQLDGALSLRVGQLRELLLNAEALLAYTIDFPEEDDGPLDPTRVVQELDAVELSLRTLLSSAPVGERLRVGALVVLAGAPNAGKSSLFNALLGRERALVTEIAGTTRDAIEADLVVEEWPIRLVDTAGLRESGDRLERLGIEVSLRYLEQADLILFCLGPGESLPEGLSTIGVPILTVHTKADLAEALPGVVERLAVSVLTGSGLDRLRWNLADLLFSAGRRSRGDEVMLTAVRHRVAVESALKEVGLARDRLQEDEPVLAAHHLLSARMALEELIGKVDREEIFDLVFGNFCVGK